MENILFLFLISSTYYFNSTDWWHNRLVFSLHKIVCITDVLCKFSHITNIAIFKYILEWVYISIFHIFNIEFSLNSLCRENILALYCNYEIPVSLLQQIDWFLHYEPLCWVETLTFICLESVLIWTALTLSVRNEERLGFVYTSYTEV